MDKNQPNLNNVLNSPQAAELLKNRQAMEDLLHSNEARRLMDLLNQSSGDGLKTAAQSALNGNPAQLMGLVEGLMKNPQSVQLLEQLNKKVPK